MFPGQQRHVLAPCPERWDVDRDHVQAIVEVLAKFPRLDLGREVLVRRGEDARIDRDRARAAEPLDLAGLDRAQELGLRIQAHVADLVEEEGSEVRGFEASALHLRGSRERTLLVAEELALDEILGERGAVQPLERAPRAGREPVDGARDQLLSGPALAAHEHLRVALRDLLHLGADLIERAALPDHLVGRAGQRAQALVLALERFQLERALHGHLQSLGTERLLDEIHGAEADRLHRLLDGAVARHEHDRQVGMRSLHRFEKGDAVLAGKAKVGEEEVHLLIAEHLFRFLGARGREDIVVALQARGGLEQDGGLVVDDEDADLGRAHEAAFALTPLPGRSRRARPRASTGSRRSRACRRPGSSRARSGLHAAPRFVEPT
jgi:hypothetical protein